MKARRLIALLLLAGAGLAPAARGEGVAVTLRERRTYEVEGSFLAPVPRAVAWEVLTDYARIGEFVPAVKRSWAAERNGREVMVGQDLAGGWLFFSRRVLLRLKVSEEPPSLIRFEDLALKDFSSYAGQWGLENVEGGTRVTYRLRAEPRFHVPVFVSKSAFKSGAQELLKGIRGEMMRRGGTK